MPHKILFYPVGNGDTSQIILANGKRLLFDFRHQAQGEDNENPIIDLDKRLRQELKDAGRKDFDVVAFTHCDKDHIANSTQFFELEHADKYCGEGRIKIKELWVPAAMILETACGDEQSDEFVLWRQEARYRLREGKGIQVFSKPEKLKSWLEENKLTLDSRRHLITDAGQLANGFSISADEVEFFCHSPFIKHVDGSEDILRNESALIFNVRFEVQGVRTDYLAVGDSTVDVLEDIVDATKAHGNEDRLDWDLHNVPHHCSYKALADEKGDTETEPTEKIKELLRRGNRNAYEVSSSRPIPDTEEGRTCSQPPHIQAKKAYQRYLNEVGGRMLLVTMEEPSKSKPEPLEFEVSDQGLRYLPVRQSGTSRITSAPPPRAGTSPRAG